TPIVPFAIVADVAVLVESKAAFIQTTLPLQALQGFILILFAVRLDQAHEHPLQLGLLIGAQFWNGNARKAAGIAMELHRRLVGPIFDESLLLLFAVEHLVNKIGLTPLLPKYIPRMAGLLVEAAGGMAIKDRPTESHMVFRVAVGPDRHVP